jgi:hypothetical protein
MICDTPYKSGDPVMGIGAGIAAGVIGGAVMFAILRLFSGPEPAGIVTFCAAGALFGLLYAVSQLRVPMRSIVFVAVFYGIFLWIILAIVLGAVAGGVFRNIRSLPFFVAFVSYGATLGAAAALVLWRKPAESLKLPVD